MTESKDLLRMTKEGEGLGVEYNICGPDEMYAVCMTLATCLKRNEAFLYMLLGTIREAFTNKEFAKMLDGNCYEMPDFESILKEKSNG